MKCPSCGSNRINKNGHHHGKQNYVCKQCGRQFVEFYSPKGYSQDVKELCIKMYLNGMGFREIERVTGINHNTIINWVREAGIHRSTPPKENHNSLEAIKVTDFTKKHFFGKSFFLKDFLDCVLVLELKI